MVTKRHLNGRKQAVSIRNFGHSITAPYTAPYFHSDTVTIRIFTYINGPYYCARKYGTVSFDLGCVLPCPALPCGHLWFTPKNSLESKLWSKGFCNHRCASSHSSFWLSFHSNPTLFSRRYPTELEFHSISPLSSRCCPTEREFHPCLSFLLLDHYNLCIPQLYLSMIEVSNWLCRFHFTFSQNKKLFGFISLLQDNFIFREFDHLEIGSQLKYLVIF